MWTGVSRSEHVDDQRNTRLKFQQTGKHDISQRVTKNNLAVWPGYA